MHKKPESSLHPLIAAAAVSIIVANGLLMAVLTGLLPDARIPGPLLGALNFPVTSPQAVEADSTATHEEIVMALGLGVAASENDVDVGVQEPTTHSTPSTPSTTSATSATAATAATAAGAITSWSGRQR